MNRSGAWLHISIERDFWEMARRANRSSRPAPPFRLLLVQRPNTRPRRLSWAAMPDVVEVPWTKMRIASYGVGPKKQSEHFCYISAQKNDVNLGFYYGAELPDPNGLLGGTGKLLRHVKIHDANAIRSQALRRL